jgi:fatty-acyl-CoA synthase
MDEMIGRQLSEVVMTPSGIGEWLVKRDRSTPERIALVDAVDGRQLTFAELNLRTDRLATGLRSLGVKQGDRVGILAQNCIEYVELLFGVAKLGAVLVPINYRLSPREIAYVLSDSGASILAHSVDFEALASAALMDADFPAYVKTRISFAREQEVDPQYDRYEGLIAEQRPQGSLIEISSSETAMLMYTSGTTGLPKGAKLTHGNLEWNAINMASSGGGLLPGDVTVTAAPLFHIGGLGIFTLPLVYVGGTTIIQAAFDPKETLRLMSGNRGTVQFLVPAMWSALSQVADFDSYDMSSLRYGLSGGAPCPLTVIEFFQEKGWDFVEGFGMTELSPCALILEAKDVLTHAGSVGRPFLHVEISVFDEDDKPVQTNVVGELVVRGPTVFDGYWGLPSDTAEAMRSGWFHSGDLARIDDEGFVTLVDRKKDMVISGGENVYATEVEQVLIRHPSVREVAVIGLPDARWGEVVTAVVVIESGHAIEPNELIEWSSDRIASFKRPRRVYFVDELPRNAVGKVLKRSLRTDLGGSDQAVMR